MHTDSPKVGTMLLIKGGDLETGASMAKSSPSEVLSLLLPPALRTLVTPRFSKAENVVSAGL